MDKEQAIEIIERHIDNNIASGSLVGQALSMAIDALKTQLCREDTTSDLIDRQQAIDAIVQCTNCGDEDALREYVLKHNLDNGWTGGILEALDAVKDLPTAQPEPKEGHWKKDESDDCPIVFQQFRICSVCGTIEMSETNYCPNCGAKMKGVRNETD